MKGIFIATALLLLFACNNKPAETTATDAAAPTETKQERNKKIIEASFTAMRNLDAEAMAKEMAADIVDYGDGSMPPLKGTDSVKKYMGMWMAAMESFKAENVVILADGDRVWAYGTYTGKFKEDLQGMPVKGKTWTIDFNKAYNPYCAYNYEYSCPIVPLENDLDIEILAGVKKFHD